MIEVTHEEILRCQFGTSSWGGSRYNAFAFTELGVAMLSSVLHSEIAIEINRQIMRAFFKVAKCDHKTTPYRVYSTQRRKRVGDVKFSLTLSFMVTR